MTPSEIKEGVHRAVRVTEEGCFDKQCKLVPCPDGHDYGCTCDDRIYTALETVMMKVNKEGVTR